MIQRIQSIWLLLAALAAFFTFRLPVYGGNSIVANNTKTFISLTAGNNVLTLVLTVATGVLALVAVFLYKNRKLQLRLTVAALVFSLLTIVLYYLQSQKFVAGEGHFTITAVLALLVPFFLVLAARGISADQKLVKSLDRLR